MGKAAVQVANSLDHAVEHLFEGWSVSPPAEKWARSSIETQVCEGAQQRNSCTLIPSVVHYVWLQ